MMLIRPIRENDFDSLKELLKSAGKGFITTLALDDEHLKSKINESLRAFDAKVKKPRGESYLFVLEDTEKKKIVGTSGIVSKVGGFEPFYTYKIDTEHFSDPVLKVNKNIKLLFLEENHNGPSEICSLYILPHYRKHGLGRLISLSRFLFMAEFSARFEKKVISELRGVSDENGKSPFWECVGRHFFDTDFSHADFLSGLGNKDIIENLMPRHPIYLPMLPHEVQSVIGKVHEQTRPALHLLESEGFKIEDEVDIFDAGPTVSAKLASVRSVKNSMAARVKNVVKEKISSVEYIISNTNLDFRACLGKLVQHKDGAVDICEKTAIKLQLTVGDSLRYVSLR